MNKKQIIPFLLTMPILFSCEKNQSSACDPDDMFCDIKAEDNVDLHLQEDTNTNYQFENVKNNSGANYEIFIRSFYDSNGDGIGDLNGVKEKLPYLSSLGVSNIWLMPFNPSPSYHGYDVIDYYSINEEYGTLDDMKGLIAEAKKYNIGIIMDLVLNHSSTQCKYFQDSCKAYKDGDTGEHSKANWYNWSSTSRSGYSRYQNNCYYESEFSSSMPDFNLDNNDVREEMLNIVKYWIDLGISGFRLDAVLYYYGVGSVNSSISSFLKWLNDEAKEYNPNIYFVGEAWSSFSSILPLYSTGIDSFFNFTSSMDGTTGNGQIISVSKGFTKPSYFAATIEEYEKEIKEKNSKAVNSYFLSNHDMDRSSKSLSGDVAKLAASITYLLPGTPYIYYGEEISLKGKRNTSPDDNSDVKRRLPMIWSKTDKKGECKFPEPNRKDLDNTIQVEDGAIDQLKENYSLTNHYKKVLNIRNKYSFIRDGVFESLIDENSNDKILAYKITNGNDKIAIVHNISGGDAEMVFENKFTKISDSINVSRKIPKLENDKLSLGGYSTVILQLK